MQSVVAYRYDGISLVPDLLTFGGSVAAAVPGVPDRSNLIPGQFFPSALNTGSVTPYNQMAVIAGNVSWGAEHDGATITGTRFTGRLTLNCINITFIDCWFEGSILDSTSSLCVWVNGTRNQNVRFIDSTFKPLNPTHDSHCIMGHHFTATRCEFTGGVDGVSPVAAAGLTRCDVRIEGSWIHDLAFFSPDSRHSSNDTHNDCIQWGAGLGLAVIGCRLEGFADPTIGDATKPSVDSGATHVSGNKSYPSLAIGSGLIPVWATGTWPIIGELEFRDNWVSGGSIGVNMGAGRDNGTNQTFFTSGDASITGNKFGWDWLNGQDYIVNHYAGQSFTYSGNYRWGGAHAPWFHGDAVSGLTHNEDIIDPWDTSVPFTILK